MVTSLIDGQMWTYRQVLSYVVIQVIEAANFQLLTISDYSLLSPKVLYLKNGINDLGMALDLDLFHSDRSDIAKDMSNHRLADIWLRFVHIIKF